jgi:hypothetical protein
MTHSPFKWIGQDRITGIRDRWTAILLFMTLVMSVPALGAGKSTAPEPLPAAGEALVALPGPAGGDLHCLRGTDGRFSVFYAPSGSAANSGRIVWVSGLSGSRAGYSGAGLMPRGRSAEAKAYGPTGLLLPGDVHPSVAWIERQDGGCKVFHARTAERTGQPGAPEAVFPLPVDLVRFLHGAGSWLVWVESHTYNDQIVACHRGSGEWETPVAVSLADDSEDLSPRVALHPSGAPWVVWAGTRDGGRDEILISRLKGGKWVREQLVSGEDDTPDVLPNLVISADGLACAVWLGFSRETRDYRVTTSFSRDGESWSAETRLGQGSFSRPPELFLLDNGHFLLVWCDAAGVLKHAEHDGERWSAPRTVAPLGGSAAAPATSSLLLLHRSNHAAGGLVAVSRPLP